MGLCYDIWTTHTIGALVTIMCTVIKANDADSRSFVLLYGHKNTTLSILAILKGWKLADKTQAGISTRFNHTHVEWLPV